MAAQDAAPQTEPSIVDKRRWPVGNLPRHIQAWTLLGIAGLMTAVMLLSGPATPALKPPANPALQTTDPNRGRIQQYERHLDETAQRLAAEKAEVEMLKRTWQSSSAAIAPASAELTGTMPTMSEPAAAGDGLEQESRQRVARSMFASSVVWTAPSLAEARPAATAAPPPDGTDAAATAAHPSGGAPGLHVLRQGTLLDAVLLNRLDGQFTGPANALVTMPAYSDDRQHVLIPAGSRLLGEAKAVEHRGQSRLAVTFHRLLLPSGDAFDLDQVRGLNQAGDHGLQDQVDHHYLQVFGAALAVGALGGLVQSIGDDGEPSAGAASARGTASSFGQSATHILDRFLNVLPTVTIREGHRLRVYLSRDLSLPSSERVQPSSLPEVP
jgi:type IV secretory pathway VirB10-like protein